MRGRAVWVVPEADGGGVGLEIVGFSPNTRAELTVWVVENNYPAPEPKPEPEPEPKRDTDRGLTNVHEWLRNLSMAEQIRVARDGDVNERTVLERIYGKHIWEALVSNPRLTAPEIARIARMPGLPRPLV